MAKSKARLRGAAPYKIILAAVLVSLGALIGETFPAYGGEWKLAKPPIKAPALIWRLWTTLKTNTTTELDLLWARLADALSEEHWCHRTTSRWLGCEVDKDRPVSEWPLEEEQFASREECEAFRNGHRDELRKKLKQVQPGSEDEYKISAEIDRWENARCMPMATDIPERVAENTAKTGGQRATNAGRGASTPKRRNPVHGEPLLF